MNKDYSWLYKFAWGYEILAAIIGIVMTLVFNSQAYINATVTDQEAPQITLIGEATLTIAAGSVYIDQGATATDNYSTTTLTTNNLVDTTTLGTQLITYTAIDNAGNITLAYRNVTVTDQDAPQITLIGEATLTIAAGSVYIDQGATATDNYSTTTLTTNNLVDTNIPGVYQVTYTAIDNAGNQTQITRLVRVVDTTPPVISFDTYDYGREIEVLFPVSDGFVQSLITAATATDLHSTVTITNNGYVNGQTPGEYSVIYTAIDGAGNQSQITRTIVIASITINPVIINNTVPIVLSGSTSLTSLYSDYFWLSIVIPNVTFTQITVYNHTWQATLNILPENLSTTPTIYFSIATHCCSSDSTDFYNALVIDKATPVITQILPSEDSVVNTNQVDITITYSDDIGINVNQTRLYLNDELVSGIIIDDTALTYQTSLDNGEHTVYVEVTDYVGNQATTTYHFIVNNEPLIVDISQVGGNYTHPLNVALSTDEPSVIYYTLNGSNPNASSTIYTQPILIDATKTLKYFAKNAVGRTSNIQTQVYYLNLSGPQVLSGYPNNGQTVSQNDEFIYTFYDVDGIASIQVFDKFGNDITASSTIDGDVLRLDIAQDKYRLYELTIIAIDNLGNETNLSISFMVDTIAPYTQASVKGGHFTGSVTVTLATTENAVIYYSTDGYPPIIDASNTISGIATIENIIIDSNTNLQFFAVDLAGNREAMRSEVYYFDTLSNNNNLQLGYNATNNQVNLSWTADPNATLYYIYRVENSIDGEILQNSRDLSYPAPQRYRLGHAISNVHIDGDIVIGSQYVYALSKVIDGVETLISQPISMTINNSAAITTIGESINRATAYLNKSQQADGTWSNGVSRFKGLVTSQVLDALTGINDNTYAKNKALYYVKGQYANNNDFLARKINTISGYNINTDSLINKLIATGDYVISGTSISNAGWGAYKGFRYSAYETVLAIKALSKRTTSQQNTQYNNFNAYSWQFIAFYENQAKWQKNNYFASDDYSVYVSTLAYSVSNGYGTYSWITQNNNGSYGSDLIDTAGVLLYLNNISQTAKTNAINYLISRQSTNGSFGDISTTAIVLQALRKARGDL